MNLFLYILFSGKSNLHISIKRFSIDKTIYVQILKIGIPTLLFQLLSSVSMGLINTASSHYGDSAVAAMGIVTRVLALASYVIFGYAKGFQPVAGFSFGSKNYKRLKEAIAVSLKWSTVFCAVTEIIFTQPVVDIMTTILTVIFAFKVQRNLFSINCAKVLR